MNKGYYDVQITDSSANLLDDGIFVLTFNIDAGTKYTVRNTKLTLPIDYEEKNFSKILELLDEQKNETYSLKKLNKIENQIHKITLKKEYQFITEYLNKNKKK